MPTLVQPALKEILASSKSKDTSKVPLWNITARSYLFFIEASFSEKLFLSQFIMLFISGLFSRREFMASGTMMSIEAFGYFSFNAWIAGVDTIMSPMYFSSITNIFSADDGAFLNLNGLNKE